MLGALAIFAGCGGGRGALAGTWHPIQKNSTVEEPKVIQGNDLILNKDGTYVLHGFPLMEGRWKLSGRKLTLTHEKIGGQPAKDLQTSGADTSPIAPIVLDVGKDNRSLTPAPESKSVVGFTWVAAPK